MAAGTTSGGFLNVSDVNTYMCIVNYRRAQWTVSTPCPCGLTNRGPGTGSDGAVDEKIDGGEGGGTVNTKLARRCDSGISRVAPP